MDFFLLIFLYFPNFFHENYCFQLGKSIKGWFKIICSQEKFLRNKNSTSKLFFKKNSGGGLAKKLLKLVICLQQDLRTLRKVYKRRRNRMKGSMTRKVHFLITHYNE